MKQKWAEYLLEIIVIIFGILGAFFLDHWNEERKEAEQEQVVLKQLKKDYKANLAQLVNKIEMREQIITQCLSLLEIASSSENISTDSLSIRFATLYMDPTFDPIDVVRSEDIKLVRNDTLKQLLSYWTSDIDAYNESEQIQHDHYITDIIPFMKRTGIYRDVNHVFWSAQQLRMGFLDKGENHKVRTIGKSSKTINSKSILKDSELEGLLTFVFTFSQVCNLEGLTLKDRMLQTLHIIENEIED